MKKIKYIIPYFGKLPKNFQFWLLSCSKNPTVNWLIFTDDKTTYNYPSNVEVKYCQFEEIRQRIQNIFDFEITLDVPRKLCDYKVTYGEVFKEELKGFDFWGYCDIDLMWGNIRKFITDDILEKYSKIGFQGHSTLFKNDEDNNKTYRTEFKDLPTYKEVFTNDKGYCFDETIITEIYSRLNIDSYLKTNFAHLSKYDYGFVLEHLPKEDSYKNKRQVFVWKDGNLIRMYTYNKKIYQEEYMYIHFFCRPMTYKIKKYSENTQYVMYSDVAKELKREIDFKFINKNAKSSKIKYYIKSIYYNRKKLTLKRILNNIKTMIRYKRNNKKQ